MSAPVSPTVASRCWVPWAAGRWFTQQKGHRSFLPPFATLPAAPSLPAPQHLFTAVKGAGLLAARGDSNSTKTQPEAFAGVCHLGQTPDALARLLQGGSKQTTTP